MKRKFNFKIFSLVMFSIFLVLAVVLLVMIVKEHTEPAQNAAESVLNTQQEFSGSSASSAKPDSVSSPEASEASSELKESSEPEKSEEPAEASSSSAEPIVVPSSTPEPVKPEPEPDPRLQFPYAVPNESIQITDVKSYDGIYLEDGSDIEISGVAALLFTNTGSSCIDYAKITLQGSKSPMVFVISGLEAGATAVVMEENKAPYVEQDYLAETHEVARTAQFEMSQGVILVEEQSDGQLKVTNQSAADIPCVRLFYKFWMPEQNVFVGGITYTAKIVDLKAGASTTVAPSHYATGSSKVIMAKTYETAQE